MDHDDRLDGNVDTNKDTTPTQYTDETRLGAADDSSKTEGMTHGNIEVDRSSTTTGVDPAEIVTTETTTVAPEIEPNTVAFTPESDTLSENSSQNLSKDTQEATNLAAAIAPTISTAASDTATPAATVHSGDKKRLLFAAAATLLLLIVLGFLAWWMLAGSKETTENSEDMLSSSTEQAKIGITLTVIDGTVESSIDGNEWTMATAETQLQEGYSIRTDSTSRAVLTLDDGSAVRLDANTRIRLTSLSSEDIRIEQAVGSVYSRVVPSERKYTVTVENVTYEALGTAFFTVKNDNENGVQVYESSVKTSEADENITEGKQFYKQSSDAALEGKLTDINIDALAESGFVNWNLIQDESDANFKERLGILIYMKERAAARIAEREAADQSAREEVARLLREKQEADRKEKEAKAHQQSGKVSRGTMMLEYVNDRTLRWTYTGKAIHGYKLVYSKKTSMPVFGKHDSIYFGNINEISGSLPKKSHAGNEEYFVRVCAYTANTEDEGCVDYSNTISLDL